jgi:hypothetical protein
MGNTTMMQTMYGTMMNQELKQGGMEVAPWYLQDKDQNPFIASSLMNENG